MTHRRVRERRAASGDRARVLRKSWGVQRQCAHSIRAMRAARKAPSHRPVFRDDFPDTRPVAQYFPDSHRRTPRLARRKPMDPVIHFYRQTVFVTECNLTKHAMIRHERLQKMCKYNTLCKLDHLPQLGDEAARGLRKRTRSWFVVARCANCNRVSKCARRAA